jgi:hypothetical protein
MSRNCLYLAVVALLCFAVENGRAQMAGPVPGMINPDIDPSMPLTSAVKPAAELSSWIVGTDPDCCGALGDHTPLMTELYLRSGLSFPTASGILANSIDAGWAIQGGGRALLFNKLGDAAWTLDLGLLNIHNVADPDPPQFTLLNLVMNSGQTGQTVIPSLTAHVRSLNRTFLTLGAGREWYLLGAASGTRDSDGAKWRIGIDGGGRWGTAKAELFESRHRTDTIYGAYAAIHSDVDVNCGCCTFFAGVRGEIDYTWTDILQTQNKADLGGVNVLVSLGVRY